LPPLVALSEKNLRKTDADLLDSGKVELTVGDGWKGFPKYQPYHIIHVGAGAESMPPDLVWFSGEFS